MIEGRRTQRVYAQIPASWETMSPTEKLEWSERFLAALGLNPQSDVDTVASQHPDSGPCSRPCS